MNYLHIIGGLFGAIALDSLILVGGVQTKYILPTIIIFIFATIIATRCFIVAERKSKRRK